MSYSFINSLLTGSSGTYVQFGIEIIINDEETLKFSNEGNPLLRVIRNTAIAIANSTFFKFISQLNLHIFIHEMGHALAYKFFTGENSTIKVTKNKGTISYSSKLLELSSWQQAVIYSAGTSFDLAFSSLKLFLLLAVKIYFSYYLAAILAVGTSIIAFGEITYSTVSTIFPYTNGDFSKITSLGALYVIGSFLVIIAEMLTCFYAILLIFK